MFIYRETSNGGIMFIIRIITIAALIAGGIIAAAPVLLRRFDWMEKPTETLKKFDIQIGRASCRERV